MSLLRLKQLDEGWTGHITGGDLNFIRVALNEVVGHATDNLLKQTRDQVLADSGGDVATLRSAARVFETLGMTENQPNAANTLSLIENGSFRWVRD